MLGIAGTFRSGTLKSVLGIAGTFRSGTLKSGTLKSVLGIAGTLKSGTLKSVLGMLNEGAAGVAGAAAGAFWLIGVCFSGGDALRSCCSCRNFSSAARSAASRSARRAATRAASPLPVSTAVFSRSDPRSSDFPSAVLSAGAAVSVCARILACSSGSLATSFCSWP